MATKLASQIVTAGRWRAVYEAVELASACGVDPAMLVDVIDASDPEGTALTGLQRLRIKGQTVDAFSPSCPSLLSERRQGHSGSPAGPGRERHCSAARGPHPGLGRRDVLVAGPGRRVTER